MSWSKMWRSGVVAFFGASLYASWNQISCLQLTASIATLGAVLLGPYNIWLLYATFRRDAKALYRYLTLRLKIRNLKKKDWSVPHVFQETVRKHPDKIAFYFEEEKWTFQEVEDYSNRVANYFKNHGVKHGDTVALFMENKVEYICLWLGLTKLGAVPALINNNLRLTSLRHCISIVNSIFIISGTEGQGALEEISEELGDMKVFVSGVNSDKKLSYPGGIDLDVEMKDSSTASPSELNTVHFADKMVYIYTSGTTGLPKAAVIKHSRAIFAALGMFQVVGITSEDIIYDPLPMYHTVGGIIGPGMCLLEGTTVAVRRKFSASNFVKDCTRFNCTVAQYIGEICRYLLNTPPKPEDSEHKIRIMFGNGLRPQIWDQFQSRFKVKQISEFYGATEGNANIINIDGKPGAIGFLSVLLPSFYPCCLIKIDQETGKPLRDEKGLCIRCNPGEPGEFVGRIVRNDPIRDFHGYADKKATESKIVNDVWKKGDCAFLSGDILVMDEEGYLYFRDRRGDTFRWKGENVSTTEVEGIMTQVAEMSDVVVYGVEVPGAEGRAGMAAILDSEKKVSLDELARELQKRLPSYAQPLFLRRVTKMDMTGTYKLKKINLQKEGFDPNVVSDDIFLLSVKKAAYEPLTKEVYENIKNGTLRL